MSKSEQKYQYLATLHKSANQFYELGEQMDILFRAYWANGFGVGSSNEITAGEAAVGNFTQAEIASMMTLAEQFMNFFEGRAASVVDCRTTCNGARITFDR